MAELQKDKDLQRFSDINSGGMDTPFKLMTEQQELQIDKDKIDASEQTNCQLSQYIVESSSIVDNLPGIQHIGYATTVSLNFNHIM